MIIFGFEQMPIKKVNRTFLPKKKNFALAIILSYPKLITVIGHDTEEEKQKKKSIKSKLAAIDKNRRSVKRLSKCIYKSLVQTRNFHPFLNTENKGWNTTLFIVRRQTLSLSKLLPQLCTLSHYLNYAFQQEQKQKKKKEKNIS